MTSDFPYGAFTLQDDQGNFYFPDLTATSAYCDAYCEMDVDHQDYSGWVGHTFHQAVVFDLPAQAQLLPGVDSQWLWRTLDGLIAVPMEQ